ncbi:phage virion morphogenesis protein [Siccibacter turicensis]|uniref:Phage virion morphogenesis protein n=1 Tax=Siccibacter turicensis TaxID=357233 RepID=A0A2P8VLV2_9ENTR|nr:phage virion morphogenesis protein [Siccibacter turicensis]PSN08529.1 phage virion morphogenesis protein [Siccibacter turicensis]
MSDFKPFEDKLAGLIASLSPAGRRRLAVDMAKKLRQSQQRRIKSQQNPDGTAFAQRKRQPARAKSGRVRREMFAKLRTGRFMKARGGDDGAVVEFTGKVQRIAQVHQYGLKDKPARNGAAVEYPARELLGFTEDDRSVVETIITDHLAL